MTINDRLAPYFQRILAVRGNPDYEALYYYIIMETGELAEEYHNLRKKLPPGKDGVDGELVDVFVSIYAYEESFEYSANTPLDSTLHNIISMLRHQTHKNANNAMNAILWHFVRCNKLEWFFEYLDQKISKWELDNATKVNQTV